MNEKGFATIFGICWLLVITLIVKGIQETKMNDAYDTASFQTELNLQSMADSKIYEATGYIKQHENFLPYNNNYKRDREFFQREFEAKKYAQDDIEVRVWGERTLLKPYEVKYNVENENGNKKIKLCRSKKII